MKYEIVSERKTKEPVKVFTPEDMYEVVRRYAAAKKEQFIVITLNINHEVISVSIVSIGLVNKALIHPREVFFKAIQDMASSIVIVHNHPSGNKYPSAEDRDITQRLVKAGKVLGINVADHLIITTKGYYSMREEGCFYT